MPLVRRPLATTVRVTAGWVRERVDAWAVASQHRSRRNAMTATTRLAQHRVDAQEVADYLVERVPVSTGARDEAVRDAAQG